MKKVLFIIAFFGFIGNVAAQYDERARSILDAMSSKYQSYNSYTATFVSSHINESAGINEKIDGTIKIMGDMFHLVLGEQEIFNNGESNWMYLPDEEEVTITESEGDDDELNPSKIFTAYKSGYKYRLVDGETNASQNVIELTPVDKRDDLSKIRMILTANDNSIKNWVIFDAKGNQYAYDIVKFTPNTAKGASDFEFNSANYPNKNIEVVDLR